MTQNNIGCDYCKGGGLLLTYAGWEMRCPRCDAEYPDDVYDVQVCYPLDESVSPSYNGLDKQEWLTENANEYGQ